MASAFALMSFHYVGTTITMMGRHGQEKIFTLPCCCIPFVQVA